MLDLMYQQNGVGLAAPQVGINKRLMVFNEHAETHQRKDEFIMINPKIVRYSEDSDVQGEGCLSFPYIHGHVKRSLSIDVEYLNLEGKQVMQGFQGYAARIFQHEYDHLDGVCICIVSYSHSHEVICRVLGVFH